MRKITIYCGQEVQFNCGQQSHPVSEVLAAKALVLSNKDETANSNSPDFVSAVKYIGLKHGVETEFYLNGVSCGNDIEPIFKDFNRALDIVNKYGATED